MKKFLPIFLLFVLFSCTKHSPAKSKPIEEIDNFPTIDFSKQLIAHVYQKDIYVTDIDGDTTMNITNDSLDNQLPKFLSDGRTLIYKSGHHIKKINLENFQTKELFKVEDVGYFSEIFISKNEEYVLYYDDLVLYISDIEGGNKFSLPIKIVFNGASPVFPISSGIEFFNYKNEIIFCAKYLDENWRIYTMNLDSKQISKFPMDNDINMSVYTDIYIAADDSHILFNAENQSGYSDIYRISIDGTGLKNLTRDRVGSPYGPFYSPDENYIIFTAHGFLQKPANAMGSHTLYLMDFEGDSIYQIGDFESGSSGKTTFVNGGQDLIYYRDNRISRYNIESKTNHFLLELPVQSVIMNMQKNDNFLFFCNDGNICRMNYDCQNIKYLCLISSPFYSIQPF